MDYPVCVFGVCVCVCVCVCTRAHTKYIKPPEAIRNLITPVATPRSVRPGFFKNIFCTWTSKAISQSHRPFFLTPVAIPRSVRPVFFDILDFDINDHTTVSQTGSVVWSLTSYVEKVTEKKRKKTSL